MAVYTILSDDDILKIQHAFNLGDIIAFKGIAEGVSNSNYFIETNDTRYILTIYEAMTEVADLPFYLGATEYAAQKGLPTALPIHTIDGELTYKIGDKTCALCSFLKGFHQNSQMYHKFARQGRHWHNYTMHYPTSL